MSYTVIYEQVFSHVPYLLGGAWLSLQIAFLAFVGGAMLGTLGAFMKTFGGRTGHAVAQAYVVSFTNTPQLVQIFFLYFALPDVGILLTSYEAVLLGMTLNAGAYLTEIQRAGFQSVRRTEMDAAITLGMSRLQQVRYVILPHIARTLFPPLSNHYILMTLGTSMAAIFGVEELTGRALNVNAETFRSIEVFTLTAGLYVLVTLTANLLLGFVGRWLFRAKMRLL